MQEGLVVKLGLLNKGKATLALQEMWIGKQNAMRLYERNQATNKPKIKINKNYIFMKSSIRSHAN